MENNVSIRKLGDLVNITSSKRIFLADYVSSGIPFFRGKEIIEKSAGKEKISTELFITDEKYLEIKNRFGVPQKGDILLTSVGTLGVPYLVDTDEPFYFKDGNLTWIKDFSSEIMPEYLYYWVLSPIGKNTILSSAIGSTQQALIIKNLKDLDIQVPSLKTQQFLVNQVSTLNRKIETNQKIISNLEKTAQLLFKHWFIDFEFPDVNGKSYKSSGGEMAESELGLIPKGWKTAPIDQCADFLNGLALQKYPSTGGAYLPAIKIKELHEGVTTSSDKVSVELPSSYLVNNGDLLFSWSGSLEVVLWTGGKGALNQHLFKVTSEKYPQWFIYSWLLHYLPNFRETAKNKATTMGHIQRKHLSESLVVTPDENYSKLSDTLFQPIIKSIISRRLENTQLAKVRDLLLPKLISGEVEV